MKTKDTPKNKRIRVILKILIFAIILTGAAYLFVFLTGYRLIVYKSDAGDTRFIGKIGKNKEPSVGNVYFPDGSKAKINLEENRIEYSDGSVYVGETAELHPHGYGKLTFLSGEYYEGDFVYGRMTGYGVYVYASVIGDRYEGYMENGKRNGTGKYTWADGSYYEGSYKNDMKNGEGRYIWADGSSYTGAYVNDVKNGKGVYEYVNGDKYDGDFVNDVREGEGTYVWENGESYTGGFKDDMMDGHGTYTWTTGRTYEGTFSKNRIVWERD